MTQVEGRTVAAPITAARAGVVSSSRSSADSSIDIKELIYKRSTTAKVPGLFAIAAAIQEGSIRKQSIKNG